MNLVSKLKMLYRVLEDTFLFSLHVLLIMILLFSQAPIPALLAALWTSFVVDDIVRSYDEKRL